METAGFFCLDAEWDLCGKLHAEKIYANLKEPFPGPCPWPGFTPESPKP